MALPSQALRSSAARLALWLRGTAAKWNRQVEPSKAGQRNWNRQVEPRGIVKSEAGPLQGSRNYMVQNEPELHGFRKVVVVGSRRFSIKSFLEKIL